MQAKGLSLKVAQLTPPESPPPETVELVKQAIATTFEPSTHEESQRLVGTTRFAPRRDINNILITGGAGFIGSWVTRHMTVQYPEYNIICFDRLDYVSSMANIDCLESFPNFHFVKGNLTDREIVAETLSKYNIDCVMHFAANSHVQNSFLDPTSFTVNNVVGTQTLLDCVREHGRVARFVHVSTDEVYGETTDDFVDETTQFLPTNPYSASKAAAEMYVHAYAKSFGIPMVIVRSNNVYGPCQYPEKIIPRFFKLLSKNQPLTLQGNGLHKRRYLYGADAADGFDTILHKGVDGEAYNIGSAFGVTNLEVAIRMLELFGFDPRSDFKERLVWIPDRPHNDLDYRVDGSKLESLGWRQNTHFEDGLRATVEWYRKNIDVWWADEPNKTVSASSTNAAHIAAPVHHHQAPIKVKSENAQVTITATEITA
ncbi:dTDP-glucose 4,6-dehydratase [Aspergillus fijiensis CBS 313.89]|uniref:dTDP-D-glucose 4,6-dehydratase-like protein n=1 Tax=Aspergillus fijiensis CBS 313.89 TaxID=1448319 RepID=A0A8G1W194_9EURO|nr:dTDP-D-glucose 4,6-dehydratase-like protein [Aspergillus fijiensis CBS 313.89]RAK79443.1 dTDP-D-glucose 4,6-dehydratase-like protein [Aspergillus fijiensis CBS 313.89]